MLRERPYTFLAGRDKLKHGHVKTSDKRPGYEAYLDLVSQMIQMQQKF